MPAALPAERGMPAQTESPGAASGDATATRTAACTAARGTFVTVTYNTMGGTTTESAIQALAQRRPDVMILTELKIGSRQQRKKLYRRLLGRDYALTYSRLPGGGLLTATGRQPRQVT